MWLLTFFDYNVLELGKIIFAYKEDSYSLVLIIFNNLIYNTLYLYVIYTAVSLNTSILKKLIYLVSYKQISTLLTSLTITKLPGTLSLGFLNMHPCILYIAFIGVLLYYFNLEKWGVFLYLKNILWSGIVALALGMYWGIFSSLWGFFWVNDLVEWFLLSLISIIVLWTHMILILEYKVIIFWGGISLCCFLFAIRLNIFFTRHSFFFSFFVYNLLVYFLLLLFCRQNWVGFLLFYFNYSLTVSALTVYVCLYYLRIYIWKKIIVYLLHLVVLLFLIIWLFYSFYYFAYFTNLLSVVYTCSVFYYTHILFIADSYQIKQESLNLWLNYTTYVHYFLMYFASWIIEYPLKIELFFIYVFYLLCCSIILFK